MNNEKTTQLLNNLIEINNDRIEGYESASKSIEVSDLKLLFSLLMQTSQKCKTELVAEVLKLRGIPSENKKTKGPFFRIWVMVKAALTGRDRNAILNSCEYGETMTTDYYDRAMTENTFDLSPNHLELLQNQQAIIKADYFIIKGFRNMTLESN